MEFSLRKYCKLKHVYTSSKPLRPCVVDVHVDLFRHSRHGRENPLVLTVKIERVCLLTFAL